MTTCDDGEEAMSAESLRAEYTADNTGICKVESGTRTCYYAANLDGQTIMHSLFDGGETDTHFLNVLFLGQPHTVAVSYDSDSINLIDFETGHRDESCQEPDDGDYTYGRGDIAGDFVARAYYIGNRPSAPQEVSRDVLSCSINGCVGVNENISLGLPSSSWLTTYEGWAAANATVNGTVYDLMLGNMSPNKDNATFMACDGSTSGQELDRKSVV